MKLSFLRLLIASMNSFFFFFFFYSRQREIFDHQSWVTVTPRGTIIPPLSIHSMYPFERVKRSYHFFIANPPLSFTVCNVKLALLQCLYIHTRAHDPLTRLFSVSPFGTENKWRGETRVLNKTVGLDTERMAKLNFYRLLSRSHLPLPLSIPPFLIQFYQLYIYIYIFRNYTSENCIII